MTLALLDTTTSNQSDTATLTASLTDANGTVTSNKLAVNFANTNSLYADDAFLMGSGFPAGYFPDGSDHYMYTDSDGNSVIIGGNSAYLGQTVNDWITTWNNDNQIFVNIPTDFTLATALDQQKTATVNGQMGYTINAGNGNNTIVGGNGNDRITTGTGNNTIVCGPGQVTVEGGLNLVFDGTNSVLKSAPFNAPSSYNGSTYDGVPVGVGNNTIYGGKGDSHYYLSNGNNWLDAGGGNDYIQAGIGNNTIFGGIGNDTIFGGGGNNYINLESGSDQVVLQGGNNTVIGGSGNNTVWSGLGGDGFADSEPTANNYIYGGDGNSLIYGSAGNDTLIGGTGDAKIFGGNGNEYIVGGDGNVSIVGGKGHDTIYAGGSGTDTIFAGDGTATVYGGNGTDLIVGGLGADMIYAGDGGVSGRGDDSLGRRWHQHGLRRCWRR